MQERLDGFNMHAGLKKKLANLALRAKYSSINEWIKSITNHLYWCVASTDDADEREAKWRSVHNHVRNIHEHNTIEFPLCLHGPLEKNWILKGMYMEPYTHAIYFVTMKLFMRHRW